MGERLDEAWRKGVRVRHAAGHTDDNVRGGRWLVSCVEVVCCAEVCL